MWINQLNSFEKDGRFHSIGSLLHKFDRETAFFASSLILNALFRQLTMFLIWSRNQTATDVHVSFAKSISSDFQW